MLFGPPTRASRSDGDRASRSPSSTAATCPTASTARRPRTTARAAGSSAGPLAGRVLIVDDVITAGTAIRESIDLIRAAGATPAGVLLALDREERGRESARSAVQEVRDSFGLPVVSILTLTDLISGLEAGVAGVPAAALADLRAYRAEYGARPDPATGARAQA